MFSRVPTRFFSLVGNFVQVGLFFFFFASSFSFLSPQAFAATPLQNGIAFFRAYEFEKAISWFQKALRSTSPVLSTKQKLEAYIFLSICYYNQTLPIQAKKAFERALELDEQAKIPPNQAPHVFEHYEALRSRWKRKRSALAKASPTTKPSKPSKPAHSFRHTASVALFGAGLVTVGVGIALQVLSLEQTKTLELTKKEGTGLTVSNAYNEANQTAWGATTFWIVSGALAVTAVGVLIYELRPQTTLAPTKPISPRTSASVLVLLEL